jgi:hypothetical protein
MITKLRINTFGGSSTGPVYNGIVVEQTLVNMAGVLTPQTNAMFIRNIDGTTYFILCLSSKEKDQFMEYYNDEFLGFIINVETITDGSIKLTVNPQYLFDKIAPALGSYLQFQRSNALGMQNSQSQENCCLQ